MNRVHIPGKLAEFVIYKRSLVITEVVCCDSFESFSFGGKAKIPRRVVCKLVSTRLYGACAPADKVPLKLMQHAHTEYNSFVVLSSTGAPDLCVYKAPRSIVSLSVWLWSFLILLEQRRLWAVQILSGNAKVTCLVK